MTEENETKPYAVLEAENCLLRERVIELQKKLDSYKHASVGSAGSESRVFELVKQKDRALQDYSSRMELKARELEGAVQELNARNEELANHMAVLRLYQLIFENEPNAILGVDRDGRLIQFNSAAVRFFGVAIHALLLQSIQRLQLPGAEELNFEELFHRAIDEAVDIEALAETENGQVQVRCYRLDDVSGLRGVIFRIAPVHLASYKESPAS